jgi:transcriptional regulator GlxA family with amidase domain
VRAEGGVSLVAELGLAELVDPDIVLVPGGLGQTQLMDDGPVHEWLRGAHETSTWTASVCTGSLILAAAGLLAAKARHQPLAGVGRAGQASVPCPPPSAWCFEGKIVTAAGVSAGIDMALAAGGAHRRGRGGPGDPAGHRVRPAATL